ncbi:hypothetical protein Dsin_003576 [Dipteronia sinensis]|uniref:Cathepsin propeptide inhibitor domain-containing protein n=1 Tax=Dipteronia sinensis TaxID=43782 RepID=A0AAE0B9D2_9ROSI|nr:hypothetical protein Dsin_003576 [Dipteronia sinensis]
MNAIGFLLLLLLTLVLLPLHSCSSSVIQLFEAWCNKHGKTYTSEEEKQQRLEISEDNYAFVKKHNELGNSSYSLSLNAFADLTHHEFKASHLSLAAAPTTSARRNVGDPGEVLRDIPASKDWRKEEAVTYVKDQGYCGSSKWYIYEEMKRRYVTIDGYTDVPANNETLLLQVVAAQPVSAGDIHRSMFKTFGSCCVNCRMIRRYMTIDGYTDVPANNETLLLQAIAAQPHAGNVTTEYNKRGSSSKFGYMGIFMGVNNTYKENDLYLKASTDTVTCHEQNLPLSSMIFNT